VPRWRAALSRVHDPRAGAGAVEADVHSLEAAA